MYDFDKLIRQVWAPIQATTLRIELDRVEEHYGLTHTPSDILKAIGQ